MLDLFAREDTCMQGNHYNGEHLVARITAIPVLFVLSTVGSFFPLVALYSTRLRFPKWLFFVTRYFGSGVIVGTGFIHLLAEALAALTNPCLGPPFDYPWAEGLALIAVFAFFFFDIIANKKIHENAVKHANAEIRENHDNSENEDKKSTDSNDEYSIRSYENIYQQILNCVVLECGIVLHSIFVGLSLAIAGDEFFTLYIAIGFHQFFEGLGLGTRFATTPWPTGKKYVPWVMAMAYSLTTPASVGIGIAVRKTYPVGSRTALITTGTFDALCAGVLIYNSIAELMAYDFMYSREFFDKKTRVMMGAYTCLALGAFCMAFIGKWA